MKTFTLESTKHSKLYRVVDREGNWKNYAYIKKTKKSYDPEKPLTFDDVASAVYLRGVTTILGEGYPKGKGFEIYLARTSETEQKEKLETAGEKGSKVHNFIDLALMTEPEKGEVLTLDRTQEVYNRNSKQEEALNDDEWDTVLAWKEFWIAHSPILIQSEVPFFALKNGYAGTGDVICILTRECDIRTCACKGTVGKVGLLDWKTGSKIHPQYFAQGAAYERADNMKEYLPKGKKIEYIGIVRVSSGLSSGYEMKLSKDMKADFSKFQAAKLLASTDAKPFDPEKDVEEVPDSFNLSVQRYDWDTPKAAKKDKDAVPSDLHLSSETVTATK